jgi:hypothetical protein
MTTNRQFADSEGGFSDWKDTGETCRSRVNGEPCGAAVRYRAWESSDGAYEDYQYRCSDGHVWWIDGIDS